LWRVTCIALRGLAKLDAVPRVLDGELHTPLGLFNGAERDPEPLPFEVLDRHEEAAVFFAKPVRDRDSAILEDKLGRI